MRPVAEGTQRDGGSEASAEGAWSKTLAHIGGFLVQEKHIIDKFHPFFCLLHRLLFKRDHFIIKIIINLQNECCALSLFLSFFFKTCLSREPSSKFRGVCEGRHGNIAFS